MHFYADGIIIGLVTFCCMGMGHVAVIKAEYYFTKKCWPAFALVGIILMTVSLLNENSIVRACTSMAGITSLWGIKELYQQEERVRKGWFPDGRKRKQIERSISEEETIS